MPGRSGTVSMAAMVRSSPISTHSSAASSTTGSPVRGRHARSRDAPDEVQRRAEATGPLPCRWSRCGAPIRARACGVPTIDPGSGRRRVLEHELVDQRREGAGLVALHGVAGAGDDLPQRRRQAPFELGPIVVGDEHGVAALHDHRRHGDARHVVPQRREVTPVAVVARRRCFVGVSGWSRNRS